MSEFTREIRFDKGYDYRDDLNDSRGASGMKVRFILRGPLGAITAAVDTGWMLNPLRGPFRRGANVRTEGVGIDAGVWDHYPTGRGISSHCSEPRKDWWMGPQECDVLGGECYGDTGYLVADEFLLRLVRDGEEAGWDYLREIHDDWLAPEEVTA